MNELCLTLLCPPAVEEKVLDLLLLTPEVTSYTSNPTSAHGIAPDNLDESEQVLGRARATLVLAVFGADAQASLLARLAAELRGSGVRYWITPILASGGFA
ncbi:DUF3240 family protein [Massilia sp. TS11]|uniref:DUF3240 family protein n=1 Tax=Massilia sp. TS11 TaxID=2908003 RepID=UPI001EDBFD71|nr:DUF3240 family protein [Massilia sp. TS11]MCG2585632.1 DUF3240 family protein [Massilia sp. TS11]